MAHGAMTLMDRAKKADPDGTLAKIVELMEVTNEMFTDIPFQNCNNGSIHEFTTRKDIPFGTWTRLGDFIPHEKGGTEQFSEGSYMLQSVSSVPEDIVESAGGIGVADGQQARFDEEKSFIEGMTENFGRTTIYGRQSVNPKEVNGLLTRYGSLTGGVKDQIIDFGGTGSNLTSLIVCSWGDTLHGLLPKGEVSGVNTVDKGKSRVTIVENGISKSRWEYNTKFTMHGGLCIKDPKSVAVIRNIDYKTLSENPAGQKSLIDQLIFAIGLLRSKYEANAKIYMHRDLQTVLQVIMRNDKNMNLTFETVGGKRVISFNGLPIRVCDAMLTTETQIK